MGPISQVAQRNNEVQEEIEASSQAYPELRWFYEKVARTLPERTLCKIPYMAFVVIMPDGLMQGVHQPFLEEYGKYVVAYRIRTLNQEDAERLYFDGLVTDNSCRHIKSWWIKNKLFELGESIGLLLYNPDEYNFHKLLTERKGASDPLIVRKGAMRYNYRTPNKTFGLLHSSDDLLSMLYEIDTYFEPDDLNDFLNFQDALISEKVSHLKEYFTYFHTARIEYYRVLYRVKSRIILGILSDARMHSGIVKYCLQLLERYAEALRVVQLNPGYVQERSAISEVLAQEEQVMASMKRQTEQLNNYRLSTLVLCLATLTLEAKFREADYKMLEAVLESQGVILTQFEKTVLESTLFFYKKL